MSVNLQIVYQFVKDCNLLKNYAGGNILKKIISIALSLIIVITVSLPVTVQAQTYVESLMAQGFPQSYAEKLEKLHNKYPNWIFKPLITNLDWSTAVNGERSKHSNQLISLSATSG